MIQQHIYFFQRRIALRLPNSRLEARQLQVQILRPPFHDDIPQMENIQAFAQNSGFHQVVVRHESHYSWPASGTPIEYLRVKLKAQRRFGKDRLLSIHFKDFLLEIPTPENEVRSKRTTTRAFALSSRARLLCWGHGLVGLHGGSDSRRSLFNSRCRWKGIAYD